MLLHLDIPLQAGPVPLLNPLGALLQETLLHVPLLLLDVLILIGPLIVEGPCPLGLTFVGQRLPYSAGILLSETLKPL